MNYGSNPSENDRPQSHKVTIEFPVVGGRTSYMNHVQVIAYAESLGRVVSVPSSRNHAERAKITIDDARYGEHRPTVDVDIVVHFARNDFDGLSFGLALALADKLARYSIASHSGRIVATGVVGPQGEITGVEAFAEKLAYVEEQLREGDLLVYPSANVLKDDVAVHQGLRRLQNVGVALRGVEHLDQLRDLWEGKIPLVAPGAFDNTPRIGGVRMPYTAEISRSNPSCILFLLDQSLSMTDPFGGKPGLRKADGLADAINRLLYELIARCTRDQAGARHYYDVGVIGYGSRVGPALGGPLVGRNLVSIREVADNPDRIEERRQNVYDGIGGLIEQSVKFMIWLDPVADGGTPMCQALQQAHGLLQPWVQAHPGSFPPIVINLTDGEANDGIPLQQAEALRSLATADGNVLLFNVHLSSRPGTPILYPDSEIGLPDDFARQLFQMSSILPPKIQEEARKKDYLIGPQSRGFVFNADIVEMINFLDLGTRRELR